MAKKRILITGLAGSIGVHVFGHVCTNTDWDVVGIVSFKHKGLCDRLALDLENHPERRERLTLIVHDLSAPLSDMTVEKIGHIDYIINLASLSDVYDSIEHPKYFIENNVSLMTNMLELARKISPQSGIHINGVEITPPKEGLQAFIQFSTDEVYGASEKGQRFDEWSPILPSNPYSASKACQEAIAIAYWRTYDVPVIITNTVNNFSEMQSKDKFPVIVQKKIAHGETVQVHGKEGEIGSRYYIHSRNAADALLFILQKLPPHKHISNEVDKPDRYNITSDDCLDNLELAQKIAKVMGKELKYEFVDHHSTRPGHDRFYGLSGEKLQKLGWTPPVSFEESLANVINWQTDNKEWI